jgi:selenide,water dikinase
MGHLLQMLEEDLSAELDYQAIPVLDEAIELVGQGVLAGGSKRNFEAMSDRVDASGLDHARTMVLFDAQTSGGLLIAVDPASTERLLKALADGGVEKAAVIGRVAEGSGNITVRP